MIFKTSIAVEALTKSAGGVTASRNKGRAYFKVRTAPRNPQTSYQGTARSILTTFSKKFRDLTLEQIGLWNEFAKTQLGKRFLGEAGKLSGINAYVRINANLALIGQTELSSPPAAADFKVLDFQQVVYQINDGNQTPRGLYPIFGSQPLAENQTMVIKASPLLSRGVRAKTSEARVIGTVNSISEFTGTGEGGKTVYSINVLQMWAERFQGGEELTEFPGGYNVQFEVYVIDNTTGLSSNKVTWVGTPGFIIIKGTGV